MKVGAYRRFDVPAIAREDSRVAAACAPYLLTTQLLLRRPHVSDQRALTDVYDDEALSYFPGEGAVRIRAVQMVDEVYVQWSRGEHAHFAVTQRESGVVVGLAGLRTFNERLVNVGFAIRRKYRGQGYAYEATQAVLTFAFEDLDLTEVSALTVTENFRSQRLLQKIGFRNVEPAVKGGRHGFRWEIRRDNSDRGVKGE